MSELLRKGACGEWSVKGSCRTGVVIELKYAENGKPDDRCAQALHQVEEKQYAAKLESDGIKRIVRLLSINEGRGEE